MSVEDYDVDQTGRITGWDVLDASMPILAVATVVLGLGAGFL